MSSWEEGVTWKLSGCRCPCLSTLKMGIFLFSSLPPSRAHWPLGENLGVSTPKQPTISPLPGGTTPSSPGQDVKVPSLVLPLPLLPRPRATHAPLSPPQSQPKHFPSHSYEGDVVAFLQKKTDHLQEKIIQVIRTIWSHKSHFPTPGREYFPKDLHE